jgi:hypothetical protein
MDAERVSICLPGRKGSGTIRPRGWVSERFQKEKFLVFGFSHLWWETAVGAKCHRSALEYTTVEKISEVGEIGQLLDLVDSPQNNS